MQEWDTSCRDWRERITAGQSLCPALPLHEKQAALAVAVFDRLRLPDVPGNPTLADAGGDWFRELVRALFGSYDEAMAYCKGRFYTLSGKPLSEEKA